MSDKIKPEKTTPKRGPSAWQPIENAPVDLAVLTYGFGYEIAHFNTSISAWVACWDNRKIQTPTSWMLLPMEPFNAG